MAIMNGACTVTHQYSIAKAKDHLPRLVREAEAGYVIELSRRGKPVAVVVSRAEFERLNRRRVTFGAAYDRFRRSKAARGAAIGSEFLAGLRDQSPGREVDL